MATSSSICIFKDLVFCRVLVNKNQLMLFHGGFYFFGFRERAGEGFPYMTGLRFGYIFIINLCGDKRGHVKDAFWKKKRTRNSFDKKDLQDRKAFSFRTLEKQLEAREKTMNRRSTPPVVWVDPRKREYRPLKKLISLSRSRAALNISGARAMSWG